MPQWSKVFLALGLALGVGVLGGGARAVRADILPLSDIPSVTPESGNFRYTWDIRVTSEQTVQAGDFFTIYDIFGFVPGSAQMPAGWLFSSANVGPPVLGVLPNDDLALPNATFTWTGANLIGEQLLGQFSLLSASNTLLPAQRNFAGRGTQTSSGFKNANLTNVATPAATPEPGTLLLFGAGLSGLIAAARRRAAGC